MVAENSCFIQPDPGPKTKSSVMLLNRKSTFIALYATHDFVEYVGQVMLKITTNRQQISPCSIILFNPRGCEN